MRKERILTCLMGFCCCATACAACPEIASLLSVTASAGMGGTSGGWHKYQGNPVLGGELGTCFDVTRGIVRVRP